MKFTWLMILNFCILQWFFVRLARTFDPPSTKQIGWTMLTGIVPLTGWWDSYKYIGFKR